MENKQKHLGYFTTVYEAFNAYKIEKQLEIRRLANKYEEILTETSYKVLYTYKVEIND